MQIIRNRNHNPSLAGNYRRRSRVEMDPTKFKFTDTKQEIRMKDMKKELDVLVRDNERSKYYFWNIVG